MQGQVTEATKTQSSQGVKEDTCTENKARGQSRERGWFHQAHQCESQDEFTEINKMYLYE